MAARVNRSSLLGGLWRRRTRRRRRRRRREEAGEGEDYGRGCTGKGNRYSRNEDSGGELAALSAGLKDWRRRRIQR
jgi:hypothetical protein